MQYSNSSINHFHQVSNSGSSEPLSGHSTHFQVGGDNSKSRRGSCKTIIQSKAIFYFHWHFHFWKQSSRGKNAIRWAICLAAVQCLALYDVFFSITGELIQKQRNYITWYKIKILIRIKKKIFFLASNIMYLRKFILKHKSGMETGFSIIFLKKKCISP